MFQAIIFFNRSLFLDSTKQTASASDLKSSSGGCLVDRTISNLVTNGVRGCVAGDGGDTDPAGHAG